MTVIIEKIRNLLFRIFKPGTFFGRLIDRFFTREIVTYLFFGLLTTLVNWCVYSASIRLMPGRFTLCNTISWAASVIFAFFTNKLFVFESKSFTPAVFFREFFTFFASRIFTGLLEMFAPTMLINLGVGGTIFGVEGAVAKLVVGIVIIILNYIFSKLVSFRKKDRS